MTRERTTWNREEIRTAAMPKQADPYLMNQDHVSQNPRADKYMNGTPSSWAEDVHSPNEWEKEYSGGTTKRNEVGEPEFRPETFNHNEKAASEALLVKKADLAVKVARLFLPKANEAAVEDQAVALMNLPDSDLIDTFQRLAQDEGQQGQQEPKQDQQQAAVVPPVAQGQQVQEQQTQEQAAPQQQQAGMQQQSAAYQAAMQQCIEAAQQGDQQKMQAAVQQMVQEASQADFPGGEWGKNNPVASTKKSNQGQQDQGQGQGQGQGQQQQQAAAPAVAMKDQQAQMQEQIQAMVQQAVQQMQQQGHGQGQQMDQGPGQQMDDMLADDQLLDDMLAPQGGQVASEMNAVGDIQLEASPMDTGEVTLTPEDDVLKTLFASQETQDAEEAQQSQQQQVQASVRSPATRTVGTRPTAGVSKVGGASAANSKTAGNEVDKLTNLWSSAPDVREHFGLPTR